jgi:cytochrome c553
MAGPSRRLGKKTAMMVCAAVWLVAPICGATAQSPSASMTVSGGGVTLHSLGVQFPESQRTFAGGAAAAAINNNCLICHSAGMVLEQPAMTKTEWKAEVEKMRSAYHAPVDPKDVDAIVDYLAALKLANSQDDYVQNVARPDNPGRGAVIAAQGTSNGVAACVSCHAFDSAAASSGAFPRIAGQSRYYLAKELGDFASGIRQSDIMSPFAKALSADDIADVSAYYSSVRPPFLPLAQPDAPLIARGRELAEMGEPGKGVTACWNCHGPRGAGEFPAIPYLGGQYARYIASELDMWRSGNRKNSPDVMFLIASKLSDQDIAALAAFYQQLPQSFEAKAAK